MSQRGNLISAIEILRADAAQQRGRGQMYIEEIRRAVKVAPRERLDEIQAALWKTWGAGAVTDDQASELSALIRARQAFSGPAEARRKGGSRPRTSVSIGRRRQWAASSWLPPQLAAAFTPAEQAALAVIAEEVGQHGHCDLTVGEIAGRGGICDTVVRSALREARLAGALSVEGRRVSRSRSLSNIVRITSREWQACIRLQMARRGRGGGCKLVMPTKSYKYSSSLSFSQTAGKRTWRWASRREIEKADGVRSAKARHLAGA